MEDRMENTGEWEDYDETEINETEKTDSKMAALEQIQGMARKAVKKMRKILLDPEASVYSRIQVIDMILSRTYGKPEEMVALLKNRITDEDLEESEAILRSILEEIDYGEEKSGRIEYPDEEEES